MPIAYHDDIDADKVAAIDKILEPEFADDGWEVDEDLW